MKSRIGCIIVLIAAFLIAVFQPLGTELGTRGQWVLIGIILTLGIWIFKPFGLPFSVGAMFMACFTLAAGVSPAIIFSGFTQSAIWTLIPALFFGFALQKTGLGYRVALLILRLFKPSYLSLALAWTLIGIVLSLLTPSMTVRVSIVVPIAVSCCKLCRLEPHSRGNSFIMLSAFSMALIPGAGWLTGSLTGPIIQGAYEAVPELQGMITFENWARVSLFPVELAVILMLACSLIVLCPREPLPEGAEAAIKSTELGAVARNEIITAVILILALILFLIGDTLHISSTVVCLGATVLLFSFGVIEPNEIGTGISWDLIVFLGLALGLGNICEEVGIIDWLSSLVVPALAPFAGKPFLFVGAITIFLFIWHFIDIASFFPTMVIIPPMLPAIQSAYGVHPLVFAPVLALAGCAFFMAYQNHWVLMGQAVAKEYAWTPKHLFWHGLIYFISSLAALLISVPIWTNMGLFK